MDQQNYLMIIMDGSWNLGVGLDWSYLQQWSSSYNLDWSSMMRLRFGLRRNMSSWLSGHFSDESTLSINGVFDQSPVTVSVQQPVESFNGVSVSGFLLFFVVSGVFIFYFVVEFVLGMVVVVFWFVMAIF